MTSLPVPPPVLFLPHQVNTFINVIYICLYANTNKFIFIDSLYYILSRNKHFIISIS